jgi:putative membrane protein
MVESSPLVDPIIVLSPNGSTSSKSQGTFTDHLANERTFLAWTRTSLGIFAFGCAVTQFGGSNNIRTISKNSFQEVKPLISGLILIACGIGTSLYSIYRYYRINRQIMYKDLTQASQIREPVIATLILLLSMIAILIIFFIL